jgi:hypothetical protein
MYWKVSRMVAPEAAALKCKDRRGKDGRLDWKALDYVGHPRVRREIGARAV